MTSGTLDIQSLPSLERFDSQLLELFRQGGSCYDAGGAAIHVLDELQAPDDEVALQRLMSLKMSQHKAIAAAAASQQQQNSSAPQDAVHPTSSSEAHAADTPFAQSLSPTRLQQHTGRVTPTAAAAATSEVTAAYACAAAGHGCETQTSPALPYGISPELLSLAGTNPFAAALAGHTHGSLHQHQQQQQQQQQSPFATASGATDPLDTYARALAGLQMAGICGSGSDSGICGQKRRIRGAAMAELIRMEQEFMDCDSTGPALKRGRGNRDDGYATSCADSDEDDRAAGLSITADMDEATRARIRREKNRVAARKCRAKKMQFMVELQKTLRELMRKNEEYRLQVITWHKMFSREVRLREAMKRIIAVMWQSGVPPAASGYTANDVIIGLESGTLDLNGLVRTLAILNAQCQHDTQQDHPGTSAAAAAGFGTGFMGVGLQLATASAFALEPSTAAAPAAGSMSVPDTPHCQPGSPSVQLVLSDGSTVHNADVADAPAGGTVSGTGAELAGMPGGNNSNAAGGTATCSPPMSGDVDNAACSQSLLMLQNSHMSGPAATAAANTPAAVAVAAALDQGTTSSTAATAAKAAVLARCSTSAQLEDVLSGAGFGDLHKFDSLPMPAGLPDVRTQSSGLRALPSGIWVWGA